MSLSINSSFTGSSVLGYQNVSLATSSADSTSKKENDQNEASAVSTDGDTLEISAQGTALVQKTFTGESASSAVSEDEGYTDSIAEMISEASASVGIDEYTSVQNENSAQASAVGSSGSSTSNLSSYTESELKEMLQEGEITQAEYDKEMESRNSGGIAKEDSQEESGEE